MSFSQTILVTLCEAIDETATPGETEALLAGLLSGEPLVRVATLQGLEVSPSLYYIASNLMKVALMSNMPSLPHVQFFDMTDVDFSPELWIACHDEDEVNVKLATQMWEANGMDVEENYKDALLKLVGRFCLHHNDPSPFC